MAYDSVTVRKFGGLQLSLDAADVGLEQAVAGYNFDVPNDLSFVRSRAGLRRLGALNGLAATAVSAARPYRLLAAMDDPRPAPREEMILVISESEGPNKEWADVIDDGGGFNATDNWAASTIAPKFHDVVLCGGVLPVAFITTPGVTLRKYTPSTQTYAGSVGQPFHLGVTPTSNRLIQANFPGAIYSPSGANGGNSTAFLSDPGAPETFTATNFVKLQEGDGESIRGIATWREQTFIVKQSSMFVMGGEGTDQLGEPIFDFRQIKLAGRIRGWSASRYGPVVGSGRMGMYYLASDGVYRSNGGPPVKISSALDEAFRDGSLDPHSLSVVDSRVFLHTSSYLYVYDEQHGQWLRWASSLNTSEFCCPCVAWPSPTFTSPDSIFMALGESLYYTHREATTDVGGAVASSYLTGYADLGGPESKVLRQLRVWGTGTPTMRIGTDYTTPDAGETLTLGDHPVDGALPIELRTFTDAWDRTSRRGHRFSLQFEMASGGWEVWQVELYLTGRWPAGVS